MWRSSVSGGEEGPSFTPQIITGGSDRPADCRRDRPMKSAGESRRLDQPAAGPANYRDEQPEGGVGRVVIAADDRGGGDQEGGGDENHARDRKYVEDDERHGERDRD